MHPVKYVFFSFATHLLLIIFVSYASQLTLSLQRCHQNMRRVFISDEITDLNASGGELDPDGGFGFQVELVAGEPRQQVALPDAGVADQDD